MNAESPKMLERINITTNANEEKTRNYENKEMLKEGGNEIDDDEEISGGDERKADGFSDTILNLLKQKIGGKNPVLSGRKTSLMKQMQHHQKEQKELEKKRLLKRRRIDEKVLQPQETNVEFERQLKKLATKGVVALFNAVAKAKKEIAEAQDLAQQRPTIAVSTHKNEVKNNVDLSPPSSAKLVEQQQLHKVAISSLNSKTPLLLKKWTVLNEDASEDFLMDWDQQEDGVV